MGRLYLNGRKLGYRELYPGERLAIEELKIILYSGDDPENDHIDADKILCEFLKSLGCSELVDLYEKIPKGYGV